MSRALEDTVALVTGATDGLGRGLAKRLAAMGMSVHVHGRNADKLARAHDEILAATGNERVFTHRADLASLAEVRGLADEIGALDALHLLINNAGIGSGLPDSPDREESVDGIELRFAVNYLAGFVLTERLLPLLERSAPARIVMIASLGQAALDFDDPLLERSLTKAAAPTPRASSPRSPTPTSWPPASSPPGSPSTPSTPPPSCRPRSSSTSAAPRSTPSTAASNRPSASPSTPSSTPSPATSSTASKRPAPKPRPTTPTPSAPSAS